MNSKPILMLLIAIMFVVVFCVVSYKIVIAFWDVTAFQGFIGLIVICLFLVFLVVGFFKLDNYFK